MKNSDPSDGRKWVFASALYHDPAQALRMLRQAPDEFIPVACIEAANAEPLRLDKIVGTLRRLLKASGARVVARLLFDCVPHGSHPLAPVAIEAGGFLERRLRGRDEASRIAKAEILGELSERHAEDGDFKKGMDCAARSVRLLRHLVSENPDFQAQLIVALQILAKRRSQAGDHERAIIVAEEAVSRALDGTTDVKGLGNYLAALDTLSARYSVAGRHDEALDEAAKAHALAEEFGKKGLHIEEAKACAVFRLAAVYTEKGDYQAALPYAKQARDRFQSLAFERMSLWEKQYYAANDLLVGARNALAMPPDNEAQLGESRRVFEERARQNPRANLPRLMRYLVRESAMVAGDIASDDAVQLGERACDAARKVRNIFGNQFAEEEGHVHLHLAKLRESRSERDLSIRAAQEALSRFQQVHTASGVKWRLDALEFLARIAPDSPAATSPMPPVSPANLA